jgi:hypothetical protein
MSPGVVFGALAGILSVVDAIPYVRDILRGTTRPHRGTRLIWWTLATTALVSQYADGAGWSMLMLLGQAVTTGLTFVLSIRRGVGGLSRLDLTVTAIAGLGVIGWFVSSTPVIATACVVFADTLGVGLMLPKTWREPGSETLSTFVLASLAGLLGALAVGALDFSLLLYPLYFFVVNGIIAVIIAIRTHALGSGRGRLA